MLKQSLLAVLVLCSLLPPAALSATQMEIDDARAAAFAWLIENQASDGRWSGAHNLDIQRTATAILAFEAAGVTHGFPRSRALSWLANAHAGSVDALARQAAALGRSGLDSADLFTALTAAREGTPRGWGTYAGYGLSLPDTPLAFEAYRLANAIYADAGFTVAAIANSSGAGGTRNADGGWPYEAPEAEAATGLRTAPSRAVPTLHAITALARWLPGALPGYNTQSQISGALNWLFARTKADDGYADDPDVASGSAYETALFISAIRAAAAGENSTATGATGVAKREAAIDALLAYQLGDGSWAGDALTTAAALHSLPGAALPDTDLDGVPDASESLLGTNPSVTDTRYLAGSSSESAIGVNDAEPLSTGTSGSVFNAQLPDHGLTATGYQIVSGHLPEGVTLNALTGALAGTPTTAGTFNFRYTVTAMDGSSITRAGAITIATASPGGPVQVPVLPNWLTALLAVGLLVLALRASHARFPRTP